MLSYNKQFQLALELAVKKHNGHTDKSANPNILHPLNVMENVKSKDAKIVAILPDVIEDTDVDSEYLLEIGLSQHIVDAVVLLTRYDPKQDYQEYIKNLSSNKLAKEVKLADLMHNMDLKRLPSLTERDLDRNRKYQIAYHCLINC